MYKQGTIPAAGNLYIFNDHVGFSPNIINLNGTSKVVLKIKDLIFCELEPKMFGVAITLTTSDYTAKNGPQF
jgi:hypothetical protein